MMSSGTRPGKHPPAGRPSYDVCMTILTFRTDDTTDQALAELSRDGRTVSDVIRGALVDAARQLKREQMRRESTALAADPDDLAESRQVLAEMADLRAR